VCVCWLFIFKDTEPSPLQDSFRSRVGKCHGSANFFLKTLKMSPRPAPDFLRKFADHDRTPIVE